MWLCLLLHTGAPLLIVATAPHPSGCLQSPLLPVMRLPIYGQPKHHMPHSCEQVPLLDSDDHAVRVKKCSIAETWALYKSSRQRVVHTWKQAGTAWLLQSGQAASPAARSASWLLLTQVALLHTVK